MAETHGKAWPVAGAELTNQVSVYALRSRTLATHLRHADHGPRSAGEHIQDAEEGCQRGYVSFRTQPLTARY
jgi:hypothetical protein